jgi:hypothetical protein
VGNVPVNAGLVRTIPHTCTHMRTHMHHQCDIPFGYSFCLFWQRSVLRLRPLPCSCAMILLLRPLLDQCCPAVDLFAMFAGRCCGAISSYLDVLRAGMCPAQPLFE